MAYAIKVDLRHSNAKSWRFARQKTMYGGKKIAAGDVLYLFASGSAGGAGLFARGVVLAASAVPLRKDVERQTPRVNIEVRRTKRAKRPLGREQLAPFDDWKDGRPATELNFKFYRQATDKIVGISDATARWLERYF